MAKVTAAPGEQFGRGLYSAVELLFKANIVVTAVNIKYPGIDPLLIVKAKTTEGAKIAFIGGKSLDGCGNNFHKLAVERSVPWKEDEWEMKRLAENQE